MNKNILIGGLVGIVVILLLVVAFMLGDGDDKPVTLSDVAAPAASEVDVVTTPEISSDGNAQAASAQERAVQPGAPPAVTQPAAQAGSPPPTTQPAAQPQAPSRNVYINGRLLTEADLSSLEQQYGVAAQDGNYWYDSRSGAFGNMGGPAIGVMYPGHSFGAVPTNASNGNSGVYFNGRELTAEEAYLVAALFGYPAPVPGNYWLEANGNLGIEGYDVALGNIYAAIASSGGGGGGGDNIWSSGLYSGGNYYTGAGGQVTQGYVSVPGYGPVSHGF